jgi:hypothetical protein
MEFRFERAMSGPLTSCQRFVEDGDCTVDVAGSGFGLGKDNLGDSVEGQDVLVAQKFDASTQVLKPTAGYVALSGGHALEEDRPRFPRR